MDNPIDGHVWKYDPPDEFREFVSGAQKTLVELSACEAIVRKLTCSYNGESKGCPRNYSELAGIVYATAVEKSCPALAIDAVTLWLELQYSKMDSQDYDNLSRFASELYATIAKNLECANDHENAGRAYTSQVESLLRVVSPSYAELLSAEKTLDRAISLRREEGVDKYYTTYTMARLSLRLAGSKGSAAQKQELKRLRHAYRQLGSRKRISRIEQIICLTEMIKSEAQIIRQCRKEIEVAALAEHRSEIRIVTSLDDSDLCSILHSNPRELGVDRTPDWLPSWRDSLNELGERSRTIQETIDELEVLLNGEFNGEGNSILQLAQEAISEVRWTMEPSLRTLHALIEAVNASRTAPSLNRVEHLLDLWLRARRYTPEAELSALSHLIVRSYSLVRRCVQDENFSEFHERRSAELRFVAVDLAANGDLKSAVRLLDVLQEDVLAQPIQEVLTDHYRVFVFHDPRRSFVISVNAVNEMDVRECPVSGKDLASGWLSERAELPGATIAQFGAGTPSESSQRFEDEIRHLRCVADCVEELIPRGSAILLEPFGIYHHVPLASIIEDALPCMYSLIAEARRSVVFSGTNSGQCGVYMAVSDGMRSLPAAESECRSVVDAAQSHYSTEYCGDLRKDGLIHALHRDAVVHIAGHAMAAVDYSFKSQLCLVDGPVTALELTEHCPFSSEFVFLSMCQSSLNISTRAQEMELTVSDVLVTGGVGCVLGTTRSVMDTPAAILVAYFYNHWDGSPSPYSVYAALAKSQHWMRNASLGEVKAFSCSLGFPIVLPPSIQSDASGTPFSSYSCWAPYSLTVSERSMSRRPGLRGALKRRLRKFLSVSRKMLS